MSDEAQKSLAERLGAATLGVRKELEISRHVFRNQVSYVIHDPVTFRSHQISAINYQIFAALDAEVPLERVLDGLVKRRLLSEEQEEDFYEFIVYLNRLGLLELPCSDGGTLYERLKEKQAARNRWRVESLLFFRVPLLQPDAFLGRTIRFVRPLFTRTALVLWVFAVLACGSLLVSRWHEFTDPLDSMLSFQNIPILWCLLIALKVFHEFGHAYACKAFGGRVPEMGAFFMLLTPCAYVDASSSWSFPNRLHRLVVSLAGMYIESMVAIIALLVFFFTETSQLKVFAHYTFVLSTLVTVGFNINPLMRYDGYYVFADLLNIPNLRSQANRQFMIFARRLLFGVRVPSLGRDRIGSLGLGAFGAASAAYRTLVVCGIIVLIADRMPMLGITLAIVVMGSFVFRLGTTLWNYVQRSPELEGRRSRAQRVVLGICLGSFAFGALVPIPRSTRAFGIVEGRKDRIVRAGANGFLQTSSVSEGDYISQGELIAKLDNAEVDSLVMQHEQLAKSLTSDFYDLLKRRDPSEAIAAQQRLKQSKQQLGLYRELKDGLAVRAPIEGRIVDGVMLRKPGHFVRKGDIVTRISAGSPILRITMTERRFSEASPEIGDDVELRFASTDRLTVKGRIESVSHLGTDQIDDPRLTQLGGGEIPVDPETMRAKSKYFELKVSLTGPIPDQIRHGMSGVAKIDCPPRLLGVDLYRTALRFLHRLRVES